MSSFNGRKAGFSFPRVVIGFPRELRPNPEIEERARLKRERRQQRNLREVASGGLLPLERDR